MWNDPIVEETRRLRDEYSAKFDYDIRAMVQDLKDWERQGFPAEEKAGNTLTTSGPVVYQSRPKVA